MEESPRLTGAANCHASAGQVRVAFVTDIPTPYIIELLRVLATRVDLMCVFCSETATRGMQWNFNQEMGFRYVIAGGAVIRRRDPDGTDYYLSPKIFRHLVKSRAQIVISGGFSFPTFYALLYSRLFNARLIVYSDGTAKSERNLSWHQLVARKVLLPRVAACVAKSIPAAERFKELGTTGPVFLAPHTTKLAPLFEIAAARQWSQNKELRLLSVGRLIKRKGIDHLLRALAMMQPTRRPVRLTIVGSGPGENELRAMAKNLGLQGVQFAGFVDQTELRNYYAQADAFVFPTLEDPFGIVLLEAAASGLALIASCEAGATQDLIQNNEIGLVFDPRDEPALARAISLLADNPDLVSRLGRAAYNVALGRTPSRTVEGYLEAINYCVNNGG